jgi:hypothetical protein
LVAGAKPIPDCLKKYGWIKDDSPKYCNIEYLQYNFNIEKIIIVCGKKINLFSEGAYIIIDADNVANENELNNSATLPSKVLL